MEFKPSQTGDGVWGVCVCVCACIEKALNGGTDNAVLIPECIWGMLSSSRVPFYNIADD